MQPPIPELAKMTGLERGTGAVMGDFVVADIIILFIFVRTFG